MRDFTVKIREFTLEYFDDEHLYLVDGLIVPSITQILKIKFGGKYEGIALLIAKAPIVHYYLLIWVIKRNL